MGVSDEEQAPTFTKKPTLRQEDDGNKLVFECQLVTNPKATIQWYRGEVPLHDDHRTKVTMKEIGPNKFNITLELNDVFETDAGMYKVTAKNKLGDVSASINLNFSPADEPHEYRSFGMLVSVSRFHPVGLGSIPEYGLDCVVPSQRQPIWWSHNEIVNKPAMLYG